MYITDFKIIRPRYERSQEEILDWISRAHSHHKDEAFRTALREKLFSIGLGDNKIQKRGFHLNDCNHVDWENMEIYNVEESNLGSPLDQRMAAFDEAASEMFEKVYPEDTPLPSQLIHTTCTGYVAPSPAQKLVARKKASGTTVTHAYHMGCYGAVPSVRMAMGHVATESKDAEVVHTELCSLHMNPSLHTTEQLVVQSLFADGCIKYRVTKDPSMGLEIGAIHEEIIPGTETKMTWDPKPSAFHMTISKDIPVLLRRSLGPYLVRLFEKVKGFDPREAYYAIHPGGPKIIEQIAEHLNLDERQVAHSKGILQNYGNMSSATIPHVWQSMVEDETVPDGQPIVSLAFGPGLSIAGGLMIKRRFP